MAGITEQLSARLAANEQEVAGWIAQVEARQGTPFTASVDLRDAGFKLAPIDTNLFPGGYNNLCSGDLDLAARIFRDAVARVSGEGVRKIGVVAESHTSNLPYFENLRSLQRILETAGYEVRVLSLAPNLVRDVTEVSLEKESLHLYRASRTGARLGAEGFAPELLLLNNDLSGGVPPELVGLGQPLLPAPEHGWWRRRKSVYFDVYDRLAKEAGALLDLDPWLVSTFHEQVEEVDFDSGTGLDAVAEAVERIKARIAEKYAAHGVEETPYVVVKSDAGTYGMAVLPVESGEQVAALPRKERKRMTSGKGGVPVRQVIVQEGVPTAQRRDGGSSEPVFYLTGGEVVGGFFRVNARKGPRENLNSRGASFEQICYHRIVEGRIEGSDDSRLSPETTRSYTFIARLAALAAGGGGVPVGAGRNPPVSEVAVPA